MRKVTTQVNFGIASAIFCLICAFSYCVIYADFDPVWLGIYFFWCLCFLLSCTVECLSFKVFQVLLFVVIAGVCFKYSYNKIYGMAPIMMAFMVCYRYGVYDKNPLVKLSCSFFISLIVMLLATGFVIDILIWSIFLTAFSYYIWMVCNGIKQKYTDDCKSFAIEVKRLVDPVIERVIEEIEKGKPHDR